MPLISNVSVSGLASGASITLPHTLGVVPDVISPDRASPIVVVSYTATQITFRNDGTGLQDANFLVMRYHSVVRNINAAWVPTIWKGNPGASSSGGATAYYVDATRWSANSALNMVADSTGKGNGTDNLAAFKAAFAYAQSIGYDLYIPPPATTGLRYRMIYVDGNSTIVQTASVRVFGAGRYSSVFAWEVPNGTGTASMFRVASDKNFTFEDIGWIMADPLDSRVTDSSANWDTTGFVCTTPLTSAIRAVHSFTRAWFSGWSTACLFGGGSASHNFYKTVKYFDCDVTEARSVGILISSRSDLHHVDTIFDTCRFRGYDTTIGTSHNLYINPNCGLIVSNCFFSTVGDGKYGIQNWGTAGVAAMDAPHVIYACYFDTSITTGILTNEHSSTSVIGCTFRCPVGIHFRASTMVVACSFTPSNAVHTGVQCFGAFAYSNEVKPESVISIDSCRFNFKDITVLHSYGVAAYFPCTVKIARSSFVTADDSQGGNITTVPVVWGAVDVRGGVVITMDDITARAAIASPANMYLLRTDGPVKAYMNRVIATARGVVGPVSGFPTGLVRSINSAPAARAPLTAYIAGDIKTNGGNVYLCITDGTTSAGGGPTTLSSSITDGTCVWKYLWTGTSGGLEVTHCEISQAGNAASNCFGGDGSMNPFRGYCNTFNDASFADAGFTTGTW